MNPSGEQQAVIDAPLAPLAVIACAGSGKTATAVHRLVAMRRLLGEARGRIALLSFSNVAVDTFRQGRAAVLLSRLPGQPRTLGPAGCGISGYPSWSHRRIYARSWALLVLSHAARATRCASRIGAPLSSCIGRRSPGHRFVASGTS